MDRFLGIDIGVENTYIGIGNREGLEVDVRSIKTKNYWSEDKLVEAVRDVLSMSGFSSSDLKGIGIGASAVVDTDEKKMAQSKYLEELSFRPIEDEIGVPVHVEANCNTSVIAEKMFGDGMNVENLATVNMWGGIGVGIYFNGNLLSRSNRMPAAGSITLDYNTGSTWMDMCSGESFPDFLKEMIQRESRPTDLKKPKRQQPEYTIEYLQKKAGSGDDVAIEYLEDLAYINSIGISNVVNAYAPELITFRGRIAENHPELMQKSFERVKYHAVNPVPEMKITDVENIGVRGAIGLAIKNSG